MPYLELPNLSDCVQNIIEVRVSRVYLTKMNKAFKDRNIWGTETYTSNSDIVCIL